MDKHFSSTSNPEYSKFIALSRYARWLPEQNRRETWEETVDRYVRFFETRFESNEKVPKTIYSKMRENILDLKTMPSMRALMTAGPALEKSHVAGYNCSFIAVDNPRAFDEAMYVLMNGTGVGFSVERQFTNRMPEVAEEFHDTDTTIKVGDSKKGWAKAYRELISLLYVGQIPKWDMSEVRPAGARLKTFGGRASGPEPLDELFRFTTDVFKKAKGRKLNSLEAHDLMCKIGEIVVVGGVRRSALISLSNLSDDRMRDAKKGQFWLNESQRSLANNSASYTEKPEFQQFMKEWVSLYESKTGERGIFNRTAAKKQAQKTGRRDENQEFGTNPCMTGDMVVDIRDDASGVCTRLSLEDAVYIIGRDGRHSVKAYDAESGTSGYFHVSKAHKTKENAKILKITDSETGKSIRVTEDHLVYTKNRGFVEAKDIKPDDILQSL